MRIVIGAKPTFTFNLSKKAVDLLMKVSSRHYDSHCRSISQIGGFLYGWKNQFDLMEEDPTSVKADFGQLDTLLKVMEMCTGPAYSGEDIHRAATMAYAFHMALSQANRLHNAWHEEVETKNEA